MGRRFFCVNLRSVMGCPGEAIVIVWLRSPNELSVAPYADCSMCRSGRCYLEETGRCASRDCFEAHCCNACCCDCNTRTIATSLVDCRPAVVDGRIASASAPCLIFEKLPLQSSLTIAPASPLPSLDLLVTVDSYDAAARSADRRCACLLRRFGPG